ncbi:hypothetical protein F511_10199 [Dorcoceras hygrometricum]|uniref:Uncharacterized protein n=1 Tax=Dorcoceras hygrometricum TaxID=472368 RepID=A0A2Z7D212_9LAMI|nr:hypothetical protein F511_10199 [Dorcoceras hygrometricum]
MREKISNGATNKMPCSKTGKGSWFLDTQKVESPIVQQVLDLHCEFRQNASTGHAQTRSLENNGKPFHGSKVCNDDELVRHMSNLPSFLQKVEREKSVQEKALNFGVLDWKQLEKWKYNERVPTKAYHKASSYSRGYVCMATGPSKVGPCLKKQYSSNGSNPSVVSMGKHPIPYSRFSSPHEKPSTAHISSSCSTKKVRNETHLRKEKFCEGGKTETSDQDYQATQSGCVDRHQNCHQRVENNHISCSETTVIDCPRKDTKKKNAPRMKALSVELEHKLSLPKNDTVNGEVKKSEMNPQYVHVEPLPHDVHIMPSICALPVNSEVHSESSMEPHNMVTFLANEVDIYKGTCPELNPVASVLSEGLDIYKGTCPELNPVASVPSEGRCMISHEKTTRPTFSIKAPRRSVADTAEKPAVKGRRPSPTRWFSFGFGKMNKEISTVPQLTSTYTAAKSGLVTESSSGMNKFGPDKANRGRSSPLRRLLEPLIKYKGSQSTKIVQPPFGPLYSGTSGTPETMEPSQGREYEGVTGKVLLQLTLKNELPFFKLLVENSSSHMLAAVVKRLPSNSRNDHCMIYAFYSVHEPRKKSVTWTQGSQNKICGLDYKIVGQMKISSFYIPKLHAKESSHWAIRECVLYGVDREEDKQAPELASGTEIAAVVLKSSCQNLNDGMLDDDQKPYREKGLPQCVLGATFDVGEDENSISTAVILPGSAHGNPSKGAPSSLINRWRSGGSCDCGGWDVGCRIRVLTGNGKSDIISKKSRSSSAIGHINLFVQDAERKSKPVLNLESFDNGYYSLDLDPSIPFLEAFATCVAFITSQKFSEILDNRSQEKVLEDVTGKNELKTATTFQGQIPAKYVSCPPPSPVGRI